MAKQIQLTTFGFMQYLDEKHFNWSDEEKEKHFKDSTTVLKRICARLHDGLAKAGEVDKGLEFEFSGINHDKDTDLVFDPTQQIEVIEPISEHIHGVVTLPKKRDLNVIAEWIGLEPQFVEKPKKGRYGRENMLAYLIHAKSPSKYQYDPIEVETFGTWDFYEYWTKRKPAWDRFKATRQTKENKVSSHWLVKQVQLGKLTKKDIMKNDEYKSVYADNMTLINDAINFRNEDVAFKTLSALENGEFNLTVYFFYGKPGAGKTYMARQLAKRLEDEYGWETYEASNSNPMDDYTSEEIVILDDLRAANMTSTQWLQMMDHLSRASIDARYKNKGKAYRTLFISAYQDPYAFFSYAKGTGGTNEALQQFIRRLLYHVQIIRTDSGDRTALVEQVVQDNTPRAYDLRVEDWLDVANVPLLSNGVPMLKAEPAEYNELSVMSRISQGDIKMTNYFGAPIYIGPVDKAVDGLVKIIKDRNTPEKVDSIDERMEFGKFIDGGLLFEDEEKEEK